MMPRLAALSISEKPVDSDLASVTEPRAFFSAERRRDFPARFRAAAFSACRCCFSAERVFAMNCSFLSVDSECLQPLPRHRSFGRGRVFVNDVLQLHDSLRLLAERDVRVSLLQQRAGNLVR